MPAIDHCHEQVKHALQKENWSITSDPYTITLPDRFLYIDLEAQRGSNGQTEQIILVEVKCFSSVNRITHDLYVAIGQYVTYRVAITQLGLPHDLYLAVPDVIYKTAFDTITMQVIRDSNIKVVLVDMNAERVIRWIK